jgi:hypothetical protein
MAYRKCARARAAFSFRHQASGVVFGSLLLGLCRSWLSWPCVIEPASGGVFDYVEESEQL